MPLVHDADPILVSVDCLPCGYGIAVILVAGV